MQMLSRDSTWPENNKKSLNKNGNTFCFELLNRTGLGQCVMQESTRLCLAFFEFFAVLENKWPFQLDPVPQSNKYLKKAKHRSDTLNGINIMQPVK